MDKGNCSSLNELIFLGITNNPEMKLALFVVFLLVYLINLLGNVGMIILIRVDSHLHTPMYFFLSNLSFYDLCYSSAVGPKMMVDLLANNTSIPIVACALQFLTFCIFADAECMLSDGF
jgi:olfactory receptor